MAITPEQAAAIEAADRHAQAQAYAFSWMTRAQLAETAADNVIAHERHRQQWPDIANAHRREADRAMTFARAWARVAAVVVPPLEPVESMLEVRGD